MNAETDLMKEHAQTALIAKIMMGSLVIYPILAELIGFGRGPFAGFAPEPVQNYKDIIFGAALVMLIAVKFVRNSILSGANRSSDLKALIGRLKLSTIVTLALCEIPAILGLTLFLLGGLREELYILTACSFAGMLLYYPKLHHWSLWLQRPSKFY